MFELLNKRVCIYNQFYLNLNMKNTPKLGESTTISDTCKSFKQKKKYVNILHKWIMQQALPM